MVTLIALFGASIGGAIGWWLGDNVGIWTALLLSSIGTGLGYYLAKRFLAR